jgi:hypothetical protein
MAASATREEVYSESPAFLNRLGAMRSRGTPSPSASWISLASFSADFSVPTVGTSNRVFSGAARVDC